jgi:hypothetical protein
VNVRDRITQPGQFGVDSLCSCDGVEVTGYQHFWAQTANPLDRGDSRERVAIAVTPHRDKIRDMAENRPESVAAQADLLVWKPDDHRIGRLAAWGCE